MISLIENLKFRSIFAILLKLDKEKRKEKRLFREKCTKIGNFLLQLTKNNYEILELNQRKKLKWNGNNCIFI